MCGTLFYMPLFLPPSLGLLNWDAKTTLLLLCQTINPCNGRPTLLGELHLVCKNRSACMWMCVCICALTSILFHGSPHDYQLNYQYINTFMWTTWAEMSPVLWPNTLILNTSSFQVLTKFINKSCTVFGQYTKSLQWWHHCLGERSGLKQLLLLLTKGNIWYNSHSSDQWWSERNTYPRKYLIQDGQ